MLPFQCSCLENPRDGGAWWAKVHIGTLKSGSVVKHRCFLNLWPLLSVVYAMTQLESFKYMHVCLVPQSSLTYCNFMDCSPPSCSVCGEFSGKNPGMVCHFLLQGIQDWTCISSIAGKIFTPEQWGISSYIQPHNIVDAIAEAFLVPNMMVGPSLSVLTILNCSFFNSLLRVGELI